MSQEFEALYNKAHEAGHKAATEKKPSAVVFVNRQTGEEYHESEGLCGFAWINVKPGTSRFARWLKANDKARSDSYYGGVTIWVSDYNQSIDRKEAYARAFAKVLQEAGIKASSASRLD